ncbi:MAG: hypothetical protein U1E77_02295 [Inhella sp.]
MTHSSARRQLLALGAALPWLGPRTAHAEADRPGLHGMLLFGGLEGLYASHLPMFHSPHDVQVLLRLRATEAGLESQLRQRLARGPGYLTLEPERFDLNRLQPGHAQALGGFQANLHESHFERGGPLLRPGAAWAVDEVLLFNRLDPRPHQAAQQRFFCFGQGQERFLVKWLEQRPDIDLVGRFQSRTVGAPRRLLSLPGGGLQAPQPQRLQAALQSAGLTPKTALQWLYQETGDLT